MESEQVETVVGSTELIEPPAELAEDAYISDYDAWREEVSEDPLAFWEERAEQLEWYSDWDTVLDDSDAPFYKWFTGAETNVVLNALDRHMETEVRNRVAFIWEGERGEQKTLSYHQLNRQVCKLANVLKNMGVEKGDCVTIYMPRILELPVAMLACAKIGAMHSVVIGGFSDNALHERIVDSDSSVVITADGGYRRGDIVPLKEIVDSALERAGSVEHVIVARRTGHEVEMEPGRDFWYDELMTSPFARGDRGFRCETERMDAEDPLFLLYTSGTTGKPKAIMHTHGGYQVGISTTLKYAFDLKPGDRWWCAADPGWITGHSYIVYAPLILGATQVMYEGPPDYPYPDRWWSMIEEHGVTHLYTAPTSIRGLMRYGNSWPNKHDLSSLRVLGSVGEPINPEAWHWFHDVIGDGECPIIDTWWQTETGGFMITPIPSYPLKPGSATKPFPGVEAEVLDDEGEPVEPGEEGNLVLSEPWPHMLRGIWGDPERYEDEYWSEYDGKYLTGDAAKIDEDGYFWVIGRKDEVLNVSGHRLGTSELESVLVGHDAVAEAAVVGVPHEVKGEVPQCFVILREGASGGEDLEDELIELIRSEIGPIATPRGVEIVDELPKTRSGKIMRRVLQAKAKGEEVGDVSTMKD